MFDAFYAELDTDAFDANGLIHLAAATREATVLRLQMTLTFANIEPAQHWEIVCHHPVEHRIVYCVVDAVQLERDHPLLLPYHLPYERLNFYGTVKNLDALIGALYQAHVQQVGDWISLRRFLNRGLPLRALLATGNGVFAEGPVSLLQVYSAVLTTYGLETQTD